MVKDGWLLAWGTLTALPTRGPTQVSDRTRGVAMLAAPLVGMLLGAICGVSAALALRIGLPESVVAIAMVALAWLLTGGLHADGLADTADGLASRRSGEDMVAVMRRSDIGPAGVMALVLTTLSTVACIVSVITAVSLPVFVAVTLVVGAGSRAVLPWLCSQPIGPASNQGLGGPMSKVVTPQAWWLLAGALSVLCGVGIYATAAFTHLPGDDSRASTFLAPALVVGMWAAGIVVCLLARRAFRRAGGLTGDILGYTTHLAECLTWVAAAVVVTLL